MGASLLSFDPLEQLYMNMPILHIKRLRFDIPIIVHPHRAKKVEIIINRIKIFIYLDRSLKMKDGTRGIRYKSNYIPLSMPDFLLELQS